MKLSEILSPTETFIEKMHGEIVCVTRIDDEHNLAYGMYCTGPKMESPSEFAFRPMIDFDTYEMFGVK